MYKLIAIAGTFDRLHKGHEYFISQAFRLGERVIIGLTSDEYVERKVKSQKLKVKNKAKSDKNTPGAAEGFPRGGGIRIQSYQEREKELKEFLIKKGLLDRTEIMEIDDVYGPAIENNYIEALIVTSETLQGAQMVNRKRRQLGLKPLEVLKVPLVIAEDKRRIASTRIRFGEIDRWGRVYAKVQSLKFKVQNERGNKYKISEELRQNLKKPQGILIKGDPNKHEQLALSLKKLISKLQPTMISTIGDEVTKLCNQVDIKPDLAIIDYHVMRKRKYHSLGDLGFSDRIAKKTPRGWQSRAKSRDMTPPMVKGAVMTVKNPPGHITPTLVVAVKKTIKAYLSNGNSRIIKVIGEEDLAGLPAILLSPLGSIVIYGQPNEGLVVVAITEGKKRQLLEMIQRYR